MFLASKIGRTGLALTLLTTGMLPGVPWRAAGSDAGKQEIPAFVAKDEIKKMQEILRIKGHYQGKIDGVLGLQTRASIRAYQKAGNLPTSGQVDTRTADGLGVRPEATWENPKNAAFKTGYGGDGAGEIKKDKPSAGIRPADRGANKTRRKKGSRAIPVGDNQGNGADTQQAERRQQSH